MFCFLLSIGGGREQKINSRASTANTSPQPQFPLSTCGPGSLQAECRCAALWKGRGPIGRVYALVGGWVGDRESSRRGTACLSSG